MGLSVITIALLAGLSLLFACLQSPSDRHDAATAIVAKAPAPVGTPAIPEAATQAADSARGYAIFREQACERCHSVGGVGSPRHLLDGVGSRRTTQELRAWTLASEVVADSLAPSAARAKRRYADLPAPTVDTLIRFLSSLRQP